MPPATDQSRLAALENAVCRLERSESPLMFTIEVGEFDRVAEKLCDDMFAGRIEVCSSKADFHRGVWFLRNRLRGKINK